MEPDVERTRLSQSPVAPDLRSTPAVDLDDTLPIGTTTRRRVLSPEPDPDVIPPAPDATGRPPRPVAPDLTARIRIGSREVLLSRPVLVGRAPRRPRIAGDVEPLLLGVPSPNREVSSTHLELKQSGSTVVVRDLRATNGSVVTAPGRAPRTLAQGESMVVGRGTLLDLGDGVIIEVLGMPVDDAVERGR